MSIVSSAAAERLLTLRSLMHGSLCSLRLLLAAYVCFPPEARGPGLYPDLKEYITSLRRPVRCGQEERSALM
jgi:hypothetical protein